MGGTTFVVCRLQLRVKNARINTHCLYRQLSRYSRELDPDRVTHLIVLESTGLKYETAIQYPDQIAVVSPAWIENCAKARERVDEGRFMFQSDIGRRLQNLLKLDRDCQIFSKIFFHLIGWDATDQDFQLITRLIRRCWGTIMWEESDEAITHFIAKDGVIDESARYFP